MCKAGEVVYKSVVLIQQTSEICLPEIIKL